MCGIAGVMSFGGEGVAAEVVQAMCGRLVHRGPDDGGVWASADGRVTLGHRRLSIVDLSPDAAQPMPNEDGMLQIVFNGEIFNHAELRRELEATHRHRWRTDHSDTEVILHAYEEWGRDCLHRFRGDFAFALWDGRRRRLWLARDRAGVKPLYYTVQGGHLAFASEIKALFEVPGVRRDLNVDALYDYLSFLTSPAPATMFEGIHKLPAATEIVVEEGGQIEETRYWDPLVAARPRGSISDAQAQERILDVLSRSVAYRKVGDVPIGVFLSGGVDSSANAVLFAEGGDEVRTFSIGFDADYPSYRSELPFAEEIASGLGAAHHVRRLSAQDVVRFTELMVYHQDEPIGDVVCVPLFYVAKLARDAGVIVCQVGEGADELFCGYPFWGQHLRAARMANRLRPRWLGHPALSAARLLGRDSGYPAELLRRAVHGEPTFWGGAEGLTEGEKQHLLSDSFKARRGQRSSAESLGPILCDFRERRPDGSALDWMTYLDLRLRLPELLLARVDKMTMATSVEGRVPFLDHELIELVLSLPVELRYRPGELKRLLRGAMRGRLPDHIVDRRKQGFGLPMKEWVGGVVGDRIVERVRRFAEVTGVFNVTRLEAWLPTAEWSKAWLLYNLAVWHERFIAGDGQAPEWVV